MIRGIIFPRREVEAGQIVGHAALFAGPGLGLEPVHQVDDIEEAAAGAASDEGAGDRDGEVGLAGPCAADEDNVALVRDEVAGGQVFDQTFVDWRAGEVELLDVLGQRQLGDGHLVADGSRLLLGDLGLQKIAYDPWWLMLPFDPGGHDLVIGAAHPEELEVAHQVEDLGAFHFGWFS